jgi:hypothetical protein
MANFAFGRSFIAQMRSESSKSVEVSNCKLHCCKLKESETVF